MPVNHSRRGSSKRGGPRSTAADKKQQSKQRIKRKVQVASSKKVASPKISVTPKTIQQGERDVETLSANIRGEGDQKVLHVEIRLPQTTPDEAENLGAVFAAEIRSLVGDAVLDEATVRRAARVAVAERAWEQRLGELLETRDVVSLLEVSKQRVSTLVQDHKLIALSDRGRLRFPAWQFAVHQSALRECLAQAHWQLVDSGGISPWSAASWFLTPHPELSSQDPIGWLQSAGDCEQVLVAARRDAARAAQ